MNDFTYMEEALAFSVAGPMSPAAAYPLQTADGILHSHKLIEAGVTPTGYAEMMERLSRTFRPDAKASGGGDVLFDPAITM